MKHVAYFGPESTNTHLAAKMMFGDEARLVPASTKTAVFDAVEEKSVQLGVVPIENSTEGVVRETIDCLVNRRPMIVREFEMAITHCLFAKAGTRDETPQRIISHPQPLAQCRKWLNAHYPHIPRVAAVSTASAAEEASRTAGAWAIAPPIASEKHELSLVAENIADCPDNTTRFLCLALDAAQPTGCDKTSLVFRTAHERGALLQVLAIFNDAAINMTRIESRPFPGHRWEYTFVVDVEGHRQIPPLAEVIGKLKTMGCLAKILGSYPRSDPPSASPLSKEK